MINVRETSASVEGFAVLVRWPNGQKALIWSDDVKSSTFEIRGEPFVMESQDEIVYSQILEKEVITQIYSKNIKITREERRMRDLLIPVQEQKFLEQGAQQIKERLIAAKEQMDREKYEEDQEKLGSFVDPLDDGM